MNVVDTVISSIPIIFSILVYFKLERKIKKQEFIINNLTIKDLQEKELAKQKADIFAYAKLTNDFQGYICFENKGLCEARNVHCSVIHGVNEHFKGKDFECICSKSTDRTQYLYFSKDSEELEIEVTWEDDYNIQNSKHIKLIMNNK